MDRHEMVDSQPNCRLSVTRPRSQFLAGLGTGSTELRRAAIANGIIRVRTARQKISRLRPLCVLPPQRPRGSRLLATRPPTIVFLGEVLPFHCFNWPAPGSEDTELGVLMEPEVGHGETEVYPRVQA